MTFFPDQKGFTLIELIIVIVILGILGAAGSVGLKQVLDGYNLAQENSTSTQKAQNALDRIIIELAHITYNSGSLRYSISAGTANSITYTANFGGTDEINSTIQLSGTQVLLKNNLLINGVSNLQFSYFDGNGNTVLATAASMRLIQIDLTVQVTPSVTRTFTARVALQQ